MRVNLGITSMNTADWDRVIAGDYSRPPATPDWEIVDATNEIGHLAEPLGFDGLWVSEHFGSPYGMTPNPLQALAYFAGCTERITFGTMLVIVPWWNPIRLAHQIAYLDIVSKGRYNVIGIGRGVAKTEFDALGIPREESLDRLTETLDILELAFSNERFSYDGKIFKIPETSLRPQARSDDLFSRLHGGSTTGATLELVARRGLIPLLVGNKPLPEAAGDVQKINTIRREVGLEPCQPKNILFTYCTSTKEQARDAANYLEEASRAVMLAYGLNDPANFVGVKGYETYAARMGGATSTDSPAELRRRLTASAGAGDGAAKEMPAYDRSNFLIGTPDQLIERIAECQEASSFSEFTIMPVFGNMPYSKALESTKLFAAEVLPVVQKFEAPMRPSGLPAEEAAGLQAAAT